MTTICHLKPEKNQQRHIVHPPFQPLLQRDRPTVIHIDGCHHVFKHLQNKRKRFLTGDLYSDGNDVMMKFKVSSEEAQLV